MYSYRAVQAQLGRGVDHDARALTKTETCDVDGAALTLRGGAENLTVRQRRLLRVPRDTAPHWMLPPLPKPPKGSPLVPKLCSVDS